MRIFTDDFVSQLVYYNKHYYLKFDKFDVLEITSMIDTAAEVTQSRLLNKGSCERDIFLYNGDPK